MTQWVYSFGNGAAEGGSSDRNLLGGKGANLAGMARIGLPVPPGFTITTDVCTFYTKEHQYPADLETQILAAITKLEQSLGKEFGSKSNPLLVSVRSGARVSMPGMMDTVLNLGLNDDAVVSLAQNSNNERFAYDSYRRFIQMYSDVVLGVDHYLFEQELETIKNDNDIQADVDLTAENLKQLVTIFQKIVLTETGKVFPQDPTEQLWGAVGAVFNSWMIDRAIAYRKMNDISDEWGTAVNVQSMVFGNMGDNSATGVAFSRNPSNGKNELYGEYLINAQGEDVVAGIRTPCPISIAAAQDQESDLASMEEVLPELFKEFVGLYTILENHYRDMQDIEFTIEEGKLWLLQTRSGKRTAKASLKIAVDMVAEGLIDEKEALLRIDPLAIDQLLHPTLDLKAEKNVLAKGLPASPGAAVGRIVFSAEDAVEWAFKKESVILVRIETSPEDISGMNAAAGILTARGGMTSHAAVVARGMGKTCVSGASDVVINYKAKTLTIKQEVFHEGDVITLDGSKGEIIKGAVATVKPDLSGDFTKVMEWADKYRRLSIRTNAETPDDCIIAREFGAEGIGLCRTEHMFFEGDRITSVREMILADNIEGREKALAKLLPIQREDFVQIFKIMQGFPVNIRLLDPPLHEFLPHKDSEIVEVAKAAGVSALKVKERIDSLHESNPMLGHRGCRLGISHPEIYEMQVRAIFEAAATFDNSEDIKIEVMIPLAFSVREVDLLKVRVIEVINLVKAESGKNFNYQIGTMIELPRAALRAADIAKEAEFFSFGTNDLTQTTFGISRDDSGGFIGEYIDGKIIEHDPFVRLDIEGVGELIKIATMRGRSTRPDIKLGICGEHGGDPKSIEFCDQIGLTYVSCSPYRVAIAKVAAAQSAIKLEQKTLKSLST
ncbi:MAG: pyruvate, phosphate dikinase [Rickettsiales bacterium]|nr:pyruvate, phosphate dikinase [Rickettsiales bacterium]